MAQLCAYALPYRSVHWSFMTLEPLLEKTFNTLTSRGWHGHLLLDPRPNARIHWTFMSMEPFSKKVVHAVFHTLCPYWAAASFGSNLRKYARAFMNWDFEVFSEIPSMSAISL